MGTLSDLPYYLFFAHSPPVERAVFPLIEIFLGGYCIICQIQPAKPEVMSSQKCIGAAGGREGGSIFTFKWAAIRGGLKGGGKMGGGGGGSSASLLWEEAQSCIFGGDFFCLFVYFYNNNIFSLH